MWFSSCEGHSDSTSHDQKVDLPLVESKWVVEHQGKIKLLVQGFVDVVVMWKGSGV